MNTIRYILSILNREVPTRELVRRGMVVGHSFSRQQGCFLDPTHCYLIEIGNNVTFSLRVTILTHDASTKHQFGYTKIGKVKIHDNVFIGANSTILPGVTIGENTIVGAGSVVTRSLPPNTVCAGVPAKVIKDLDEFFEENSKILVNSIKFDKSYQLTDSSRILKGKEISKLIEDNIAFIE